MTPQVDQEGPAASPQAKREAHKILKQMTRQALEESPVYMDHIWRTFHECTCQLQAGCDQEGLNAFARGASDLGEFIKLLEQIEAVAQPQEHEATESFKISLRGCVQGLEDSMLQNDLVALSDGIEGQLLNLLPRWDLVAQEMDVGLQARGC